MPWLLLDLALALAALVGLALLGLRLWRQVKALSRAVGTASSTISPLTAELARAQAGTPRPSPDARRRLSPSTTEVAVPEFLGSWEFIILALLVLVLFGAKRLPDSARALGRSMRIFKAETKGLRSDDDAAAPPSLPAAPAAPVAQPPVAPQQPVSDLAPQQPQPPTTP